VVTRAPQGVGCQRRARDAARIESPHRLVLDRGVELLEDAHPERVSVHPALDAGAEHGADVGRRRPLGRVGSERERGEGRERDACQGA
jgi:hypothetical protein